MLEYGDEKNRQWHPDMHLENFLGVMVAMSSNSAFVNALDIVNLGNQTIPYGSCRLGDYPQAPINKVMWRAPMPACPV